MVPMFLVLALSLLSICAADLTEEYVVVQEGELVGKLKSAVGFLHDKITLSLDKNDKNAEVSEVAFVFADHLRPRFEFSVSLEDQCSEPTTLHFGNGAFVTLTKSTVDFDVVLSGADLNEQTIRSVKQGVISMDVDLGNTAYRPSLKGGNPAQDGTVEIGKAAIILKPAFAAEEPPCRIYVEIPNVRAAVRKEFTNAGGTLLPSATLTFLCLGLLVVLRGELHAR